MFWKQQIWYLFLQDITAKVIWGIKIIIENLKKTSNLKKIASGVFILSNLTFPTSENNFIINIYYFFQLLSLYHDNIGIIVAERLRTRFFFNTGQFVSIFVEKICFKNVESAISCQDARINVHVSLPLTLSSPAYIYTPLKCD